MNMMEEARKQVSALTQAAYAHAVEKGVLPAGAAVEAKVEVPKDVKNGDWSTSFALAAEKPAGFI